jgi:hypothetical protein
MFQSQIFLLLHSYGDNTSKRQQESEVTTFHYNNLAVYILKFLNHPKIYMLEN